MIISWGCKLLSHSYTPLLRVLYLIILQTHGSITQTGLPGRHGDSAKCCSGTRYPSGSWACAKFSQAAPCFAFLSLWACSSSSMLFWLHLSVPTVARVSCKPYAITDPIFISMCWLISESENMSAASLGAHHTRVSCWTCLCSDGKIIWSAPRGRHSSADCACATPNGCDKSYQ